MATRGRPKGSKNESIDTIVVARKEYLAVKQTQEELSKTIQTMIDKQKELYQEIHDKSKRIDEVENELGTLEDEIDHLKEIIKSLAEVL